MDSRFTKEVLEQTKVESGEAEINNVVVGNFPLMKQPVDYQITIHVNNMLNAYGKSVIKQFKEHLYNPEAVGGIQIKRLVNHYGIDAMRDWFTLIYGWDFTEQKVG
jgi:hypothetical protein